VDRPNHTPIFACLCILPPLGRLYTKAHSDISVISRPSSAVLGRQCYDLAIEHGLQIRRLSYTATVCSEVQKLCFRCLNLTKPLKTKIPTYKNGKIVRSSDACMLCQLCTIITRIWAVAQRDGRPAEYRWRPLFNAAKFG